MSHSISLSTGQISAPLDDSLTSGALLTAAHQRGNCSSSSSIFTTRHSITNGFFRQLLIKSSVASWPLKELVNIHRNARERPHLFLARFQAKLTSGVRSQAPLIRLHLQHPRGPFCTANMDRSHCSELVCLILKSQETF